MNLGQIGPQLRAEHPLQRLGERFEHRDPTTATAPSRGHLAADESRTDDVDVLAALELCEEALSIRQLTQIDGVVEAIEATRGRSGGDTKQVPGNTRPVPEDYVPTVEVELDDALTEHQLDAELAVLLAWAQPQALCWHRSPEEALGQMRPFVRRVGFSAGEQDVALKAAVAQARGRSVTGRAGADDYCFLDSSRTRNSDQTR